MEKHMSFCNIQGHISEATPRARSGLRMAWSFLTERHKQENK